MDQCLLLWIKSISKWFDFYEVNSYWPRGIGYQRYSTAKTARSKVLDEYYNPIAKKISQTPTSTYIYYRSVENTHYYLVFDPNIHPKSPKSVDPAYRRIVLDLTNSYA
jgi:hypothetical protein